MMETLTSRKNRIITRLRALGADRSYREAEGAYLCDGIKLLREAVAWEQEIDCVLWAEEPSVSVPCAQQYRVSREMLDYVSPLKSAQGVLFAVKMRRQTMQEPGKTLVLETIQDPGNLGTILRTADALGLDTVVLTGACADVYNPKTVRATMGAVFRQRFLRVERDGLADWLHGHGLKLYGAALSERACDIRTLELDRAAVAVGSEGRGLSDALLAMCDGELIIPMRARCESLNAAVAAAIVMWELTR